MSAVQPMEGKRYRHVSWSKGHHIVVTNVTRQHILYYYGDIPSIEHVCTKAAFDGYEEYIMPVVITGKRYVGITEHNKLFVINYCADDGIIAELDITVTDGIVSVKSEQL